jgi:hypothetical protein
MAPSKNGRNATARKRERQVDGVITAPLTATSKHPSERLPAWAKPLPNEDTRKYAERLGFAIHQDSLDRSLRGDTAAHAKWREQALKGLGLGQRTEIDVSAHQDDKWLAFLTDVELEALETLHKAALQRMSNPLQSVSMRDNPQLAASTPIESVVYTHSSKVTEYTLSEPDNGQVHSKDDDGS